MIKNIARKTLNKVPQSNNKKKIKRKQSKNKNQPR